MKDFYPIYTATKQIHFLFYFFFLSLWVFSLLLRKKKGSQFHSGWVILWDNTSYSILTSKGAGNVYSTPTPGDKFHCGTGSKCKPLCVCVSFSGNTHLKRLQAGTSLWCPCKEWLGMNCKDSDQIQDYSPSWAFSLEAILLHYSVLIFSALFSYLPKRVDFWPIQINCTTEMQGMKNLQ